MEARDGDRGDSESSLAECKAARGGAIGSRRCSANACDHTNPSDCWQFTSQMGVRIRLWSDT